MAEWISIKDKLPEVGEDIIATDGNFFEVGFLSQVDIENLKRSDIRPGEWCDFGFLVTHWLPLPKFNKEGKS